MSAINISATDLLLIAAILAVLIATVRISAQDAIRRGKSPWLVSLMVIAFFPIGFFVWRIFRPKLVQPGPSGKQPGLDDSRAQ